MQLSVGSKGKPEMINQKLKSLCLSVAVTSIIAPAIAFAGEKDWPINVDVLFEQQNDLGIAADDPDAEVNTSFIKVETAITFEFIDGLALESMFVLEPVLDPAPGENSVVEDEGLFAEELKLVASIDAFTFVAGKYNAAFGIAWDAGVGIWGNEWGEEYELAEQVGIAGGYTFSAGENEHTVTVNAFFADTTELSNSIITKRGQADLSDGGAGNTEDLSSFSATLDGSIGDIGYSIGARSRSAGDADIGIDDETGFSLAATYEWGQSEKITHAILAEVASFNSFDAGGDDVLYITTGLQSTFSNGWNVAIAVVARNTDYAAGGRDEDYLYQATAGYEFERGFIADFGVRHEEVGGEAVTHIGLKFAKEFSL